MFILYKILSKKLWILYAIFFTTVFSIKAQINSNCQDNSGTQTYSATAFFNYGSVSGMYNSELTSAITAGQTSVQHKMFSPSYKSDLGFWSQFLLPPSAPYVQASEGNLGDRVEITWTLSALSPVTTDVFKVYRNGTFLDEVENDERVYVDYNVVAGEFYTYSVRGVNQAGIGQSGSAVGFLNPNGVITGQVKTINGNPVSECSIDLSPTLGSSLRFSGDGVCFADYSSLYDTTTFSATLWVRQDSLNDVKGLVDLGSASQKNWYIHTMDTAGGRGINAGISGGFEAIDYIFPDSTALDWHHVAVTFNGNTLLLYIDGELSGSVKGTIARDSLPLTIGGITESSGYYEGMLDEVAIYNRQLSQTEIRRQMNKSLSSNVEGLVSYWKMDEGKGTTTYDLTANENRLYMCGPQWSDINAPITNSSLTNENGFYILEGINYGSGETFTVRPSKNIYESVSVEFNAANEQYASLTHFDISETDTSSLSFTFNLFDLNETQTLLSKGNDFNLKIENSELVVYIDGANYSLGPIDLGWHQLVMVNNQNGASAEVVVYLDGINVQTINNSISSTDNTSVWALGANLITDPPTEYFTGLIDELVAYQKALSISEVQVSNNVGTDEGNTKIYAYFPLNEAQGDSLYNLSTTGGVGYSENTSWANDSKHLNFTGHEFLPSSKFVSLNPTNTSTDQVDFTDLSTIPISGYVRFKDTDCFADSVEILLNGLPASPPIFTNQDGYFIAELEPGASVKLSPKFYEHKFSPAFFEVKNAISPVAGVLFLDKTTRTVSGQLAGGNCRKSIIPAGGSAKVILATLDGCYEQEIEITDADGKYTFENVPPFECEVGVSFHNLQNIKDYFEFAGGSSIDLTFESDTVDFIYYSAPVVILSEFGDTDCGLPTRLNQFEEYTTTISLYQEYPGGTCPVDSAKIEIYNGYIQDSPVIDTFTVNGPLEYTFFAGPPNIASPFLKNIQVVATADGISADTIRAAIVLGKRPRNVNFTSTSPEIPLMILHDPPGDQSYSYISEGSSLCQNLYFDVGVYGDITRGVEVSVGPETTLVTGFGVATETTIDIEASIDVSATVKTAATYKNSTELCQELLTEYTTDSDEFLVGDTSDVYIGGAMNMLFGVTDILLSEGCTIELDTGINILPGNFATTFYYTEYQILKNIIPDLIAVGDITSAEQWQTIIDNNKANKASSAFVENISFGSGVNIEKSLTESETDIDQYQFDVELESSIATQIGATINDVGLVGYMSLTIGIGSTTEITNTETSSTTIGYSLSDNDPGDIFSVNISTDPVYGTPVFETVSGVSSCPYETNTVNRDETSLVVDKFVANNVGENDAAIFNFNLGNISQSEEQREYVFSLRPSSNVNGAEVKIGGADPIDSEYFVPFGESIPVTVSVERSPVSYTDTLIFDYFVQCENDRNITLGVPKSNTPFNRSETVIVNFVEPCSSVDINNPQQDWVQTPADGPLRPISLFDYDVNDADLDLIRVQYRRSQGDGLWINIAEIPKSDLGVLFENLDWDTDGLSDGLYEIRALAVCVGGLDVGISHVIKGKIERTPPDLFGTAEPADGVLSRGDEISITFTEPIQCSEIILAAGIGTNIDNGNLGLYDTETGNLIDFTLSCSQDKIILVPNVANSFLENKVLRVELDSILDLAGNKSASLEWEFVVDQNSLNWIDREDVKVVKFEEDFVRVERRIENRGGFNISWELVDVPDWCTIYPTSGDLAPGDVRIINFEFETSMPFGSQIQTIQLSGPEGNEPMVVDARVVCPAPDYEIITGDWEYAMNFTAELDIEGDISIDEEDILAAFVDEELRGFGKVQYYASIDKHLVFLTVYANTLDPSIVDMRIWDASSCLLFSPVVESFIFQSDDLIGTPLDPQVIHTSSNILKEVEINAGWNWLSFNLELNEPSPDSLLQTIDNATSGIMKSQTEFAQYADGFGWFGSLDSIGNTSSYQLRISDPDTILVRGKLIDESTVEIPLAIGWNWIGYLPRSPLPINIALADLEVLDGDVIKSQTSFAQYVSAIGWIGTLSSMRPNEGYIIKTSSIDTLVYPTVELGFKGSRNEIIKPEAEIRSTLPSEWTINPFSFEHSMTLTGSVIDDGYNSTEEGWYLGAFHNGECRGITEAIWVAPLDEYLFFMTMYSNVTGEKIDFKLYDGNQTSDLSENEFFSIDTQIGEIENPYEFGLLSTNTVDYDLSSSVDLFPNPIQKGEKLLIKSEAIFNSDVKASIYNIDGQLIDEHNFSVKHGKLNILLSTENFVPGIHHIIINDDKITINKKFIIVR